MNLKFIGATGTVTGSKYLLCRGCKRYLIDCGLFQRFKQLRFRNWAPLPADPRTIEAVLLTHGHIDHSGYIPLLVKNGFTFRIHCTRSTRELCAIKPIIARRRPTSDSCSISSAQAIRSPA